MTTSRRIRLFALVMGLASASCGPPPDETDAPVVQPDAQPSLELGTGDASFVSVLDGGEIELVHGPQGGWHVVLAARLSGFDPDGTVLTFGVYDGDAALAETPIAILTRRLVPDGAAYLKLGDLLIFSISGPAEVVGRTVEIRGAIARDGSTIAMDRRMVTIVDRE